MPIVEQILAGSFVYRNLSLLYNLEQRSYLKFGTMEDKRKNTIRARRIRGKNWLKGIDRRALAEVRESTKQAVEFAPVEFGSDSKTGPSDIVPVVPDPEASRRARAKAHYQRNKDDYKPLLFVVFAGVAAGSIILAYIVGEDQHPNAASSAKPPQVDNAVNILLGQPKLMEGVVCPAQLDAEGDVLAYVNYSRAEYFHEAATRMRDGIPNILSICPPNAPTSIGASGNHSTTVLTDQGAVRVYSADIVPNLGN